MIFACVMNSAFVAGARVLEPHELLRAPDCCTHCMPFCHFPFVAKFIVVFACSNCIFPFVYFDLATLTLYGVVFFPSAHTFPFVRGSPFNFRIALSENVCRSTFDCAFDVVFHFIICCVHLISRWLFPFALFNKR